MSDDNQQLYLALADLKGAVGRIEGKVSVIAEANAAILKARQDDELRLRSLEASRSRVAGMAAAVGAGIALFGSYVINFIKH